ncbi:VPS9 domain-containing protein [Pseudomassariella vexata]|uniref:VPS9 domain-containing protein n=1 Tax=Pseudomassariella vexata TaxID=1141098 RepID=A0A1Y2E5I0_9PEZI|nr:VPS9 domain-containing protein [Pseudomassariella vexata]ORY66125.1 VPS9 domain-containing protein [Pseudomassariella vexata]
MPPLNPFLAAFFRSGNPIISQCSPVHHHILLVPSTEFLLTSRETESGSSNSELIASEEFLGSHVLKIPSNAATAGGKDAAVGNLRELRGKARQYNTLNGRSVVIKDAFVYSNKGFRTLAQAQLLNDAVWYPDTLEPRQWLVYYISRPLVGVWEEVQIQPAIFVAGMAKRKMAEARQAAAYENGEPSLPRKKEIKSFHDLLNNFPIIARQMQPGLEKLFHEFTVIFERPLPPPPSAVHIPDPTPDGPISAAMKKARSSSMSARRPSVNSLNGANGARVTENFFAEDDEDVMRASLETAVTNAIDLFQNVDKQQLSMLGATTELTGPLVERLIERYVTENVHSLIWMRLAAMRRPDDLELEAKIRQMEFIDISQLGIAIEGGSRAKHELISRLGRAVEEFSKMNAATCAQDMIETLLATMKTVTHLTEQPRFGAASVSTEKPLTINADTLVSLLLFVVIRAGIKHLQARLLYMRHFIFIDDVESGEMGYALSTFEAVLTYLLRDSASLRRASKRNKSLWDATSKGDLSELKKMMHPDTNAIEDDDDEDQLPGSPISSHGPSEIWSTVNGSSSRPSTAYTVTDTYSQGSGLSHVFPFQSDESNDASNLPPKKIVKRVAMDTRSVSSGSEYSYHSRATSFATLSSGIEGDTSIHRLCQTEDSFGESISMMAIQNERPETLKYLLTLREYFPIEVVLEDTNNQGTTLLSAAVQLGHTELIDIILDFVMSQTALDRVIEYLALQDVMGRSVAHYLFHAPFLIARVGQLLPWRQRDKNGLTPLFALCRSYDHANYHSMVEAGLQAATEAQGDGQPLHLDDHVDSKGNTLLHIVHDALLTLKILQQCDVDVNATNEKKFTALMVASKYGRFDIVRALYGDPRVDVAAKELRGLTAVELAKDDDVRNRIDDLTLFSMPMGENSRVTGVVRSFFVEDATIRLVLKSGAPSGNNNFIVTTCRRSMADFERLANLLAVENPASWIPNVSSQRTPFQIPSKPSRALLKDIQMRLDAFLKIMLAHSTFATHELLWEFFLVPDLQADMMEQRSGLKAETRAEKVREELEPLEDMREVEQFVDHAREMVRSVNYSTKSVARRANVVGVVSADLHEAACLVQRQVTNLQFLPQSHISAFEAYVRTLTPPSSYPAQTFHGTLLALQSTIVAMLSALSRPPQLVSQINASRKAIERSYNSLSRSTRWPLGLLDETRQRMNEEKEEKAREKQREAEELGKELRYSQQIVAGELAGWQDMHERMGKQAIRDFARGMVIMERARLEGMKRALRRVHDMPERPSVVVPADRKPIGVDELTDRIGNGVDIPSPSFELEANEIRSSAEVENGAGTDSGGESSAMGASAMNMMM